MRLHYVLLLVAAVFLSSIDASTATTATSINSRHLVFAEQDKTDGKRFLRAEVKDEDDDVEEEEERGGPLSLSGAFTKLSTMVKTGAMSSIQKLSTKRWQDYSDRTFKSFNLDKLVNDKLVNEFPRMKAWTEAMTNANKVNPEVNMLNTLVKQKFDDVTIMRVIENNKAKEGMDDVFTKMQTLHFSRLQKEGKDALGIKAKLRKTATVGNNIGDPSIVEGYHAFLKAPQS